MNTPRASREYFSTILFHVAVYSAAQFLEKFMTTAVHQDHAYNYGCLALEYCNKRLPLTVLKTRAYYIGTLDATDGLPCSRESVEYFDTQEKAEKALRTGNWTQKQYP